MNRRAARKRDVAVAGDRTFRASGDGDGCDLLGELRKLFPSLPGIALTEYAYPADERRCRAAGFGRFLAEPVEIEHLISTIEVALLQTGAIEVDGRSA